MDTLLGPLPNYPAINLARKPIFRIAREELNWVHKFGGGVKLDAKFGGLYSHINEERYRTGRGNPAVAPLHQVTPAIGNDHGLNTMGKLSSSTWEGHTLAAGWDAGRTRRSASRQDRDYLTPEVLLGPDEHYSATLSHLALYAQDDWTIDKQ